MQLQRTQEVVLLPDLQNRELGAAGRIDLEKKKSQKVVVEAAEAVAILDPSLR